MHGKKLAEEHEKCTTKAHTLRSMRNARKKHAEKHENVSWRKLISGVLLLEGSRSNPFTEFYCYQAWPNACAYFYHESIHVCANGWLFQDLHLHQLANNSIVVSQLQAKKTSKTLQLWFAYRTVAATRAFRCTSRTGWPMWFEGPGVGKNSSQRTLPRTFRIWKASSWLAPKAVIQTKSQHHTTFEAYRCPFIHPSFLFIQRTRVVAAPTSKRLAR